MEGHLTESVMDEMGDGESGPEGQKLSATSPTTIMEDNWLKVSWMMREMENQALKDKTCQQPAQQQQWKVIWLKKSIMDDVGDGESGPEGKKMSATSPTTIMEGHLT